MMRWGERRATSAPDRSGGCSLGPTAFRQLGRMHVAPSVDCRAGEVGETHDSPGKIGEKPEWGVLAVGRLIF
jgi:hypothetical protein